MDPFDEFEFKPLTDGLGFHKKKSPAPTKNKVEDESFINAPLLKGQGLELLEEETTSNPLRSPLPRKALKDNKSAPQPATSAVDDILKTLQKNRRFEFDKTAAKTQLAATATKEDFKKSNWDPSPALLDAMLVIAASLLCMIILLVITHVDLIANLSHPDQEGMIYLSTLSLFAGVTFIYLVVNRVFLGCTPGEWAFDQRIGKPAEQDTAIYALQVTARSAFVIFTGFFVLPVISLIMGQDIAGKITGAALYKKV